MTASEMMFAAQATALAGGANGAGLQLAREPDRSLILFEARPAGGAIHSILPLPALFGRVEPVERNSRVPGRPALPEVEVVLRHDILAGRVTHGMIGGSMPMRAMFDLIEGVANTRSNVLVTGESGTGKELVARALHRASKVSKGPFVALNCAAIAPTLLESELFGHVKGSFTGASSNRQGYFEAALGGTLFLDEISELPLALQPKLLRAIQEKEILKVGGTKPIPVDVRLVAASNRDLRREVAEKRFREDLFYRLCVVDIHVPTLRDRMEDTPALVQAAIIASNQETGKRVEGTDRETMRCLVHYAWPGNVRELQNVIERAVIVCHGRHLTTADLPPEVRGDRMEALMFDDLRTALRAFERNHIDLVLRESNGNRQEAAQRLGINPSTLYRKLAELGIREDAKPARESVAQAS